ncbi:MAG: glycosyltransferase family 4 protein [Mangrovibacterium sp.]
MKKQRILYYAHEYYCDYGARTHAREFYSHLQEKFGNESVFIFPPSEPVLQSNKASSRTNLFKKILPQKTKMILQSFWGNKKELRQLKDYVVENSIDIIIIRAGYKIAFINQVRKIKNLKKLVVEVNASITDEQLKNSLIAPLLKYIEITAYKKADFITVVSPLLANKFVRRGLKEERILVNPNGVSEHFFKPEIANVSKLRKQYEIPVETTVIGYIGGFERFKIIPKIVHDFAAVDSNKHLTLVIIGKGEDSEQIKDAIKNTSNQEKRNVIYLNTWIPYEQLADYMALFDINIFPYTANHVSPLKIFEYLVTGKPTIGPDIPALADIFENEREIYLVSQDRRDFKEVLAHVLRNEKQSEQIARAGKEKVLNEYTWSANVNRIISKFKE